MWLHPQKDYSGWFYGKQIGLPGFLDNWMTWRKIEAGELYLSSVFVKFLFMQFGKIPQSHSSGEY